jgi:hypothetical protein
VTPIARPKHTRLAVSPTNLSSLSGALSSLSASSSRQEATVREAPVRASQEEKSRGGGLGGSGSEGGDTTAEKEAGCSRDAQGEMGWGGGGLSRSEGGQAVDGGSEAAAALAVVVDSQHRGKGEGQAKVQAVGWVADAGIAGAGEREREERRQRADARRAAFLAAPLPQQV